MKSNKLIPLDEYAKEWAESISSDNSIRSRPEMSPETKKLFEGIFSNKHCFTAEAAHKAFAGLTRKPK
jgi:hypothetical protein